MDYANPKDSKKQNSTDFFWHCILIPRLCILYDGMVFATAHWESESTFPCGVGNRGNEALISLRGCRIIRYTSQSLFCKKIRISTIVTRRQETKYSTFNT